MSDRRLYAHTPRDGTDTWQSLECHLKGVAERTAHFAEAFDARDIGMCAGFLHDLGKASEEFQDYLDRCHRAKQCGNRPPAGRVDHKLAGAVRAREIGGYSWLLSLPIIGHHGGMPSRADADLRTGDPGEIKRVAPVLERTSKFLSARLQHTEFPPRFVAEHGSCEMFLRMLYSCLVDADFLDTESFWESDRGRVRQTERKQLDALWQMFQEKRSTMFACAPDSRVNRMRDEIYQACLTSAELPQGVFRLTVPTGGGKTLSGMAFALKHAVKHGLQRVIVAIPYTSIIDQNAKEYRQILSERNVLEHHSALEVPESKEYSEEHLGMELAAENWDMPVVVTTTVRLFESLFSNKPSKCRKLHNLAGSVIILDEVQTLPLNMVQPILDVLKELVANYHVTLVLSTATQPAFSGSSPYLEGFPECVEIVSDPERHFEALKRVEYRVEHEPWSWTRVAAEIRGREQVLCVLNSRKDAVELFKLLDDQDALHLSTLMCPAHRRKVLDEIRDRLSNGLPCRVVSTQVVEAGVDLDFPCVMRAAGPLDRIVQAAGRCNREGQMDGLGEVIVFQPEEGRAPRGNYAMEMQVAATYIAEHQSRMADPGIIEKYFAEVYQTARKKGLDAYRINPLRAEGEFPEVAKQARLIKDDTVALVVRYEPVILKRMLNQVKYTGCLSRDNLRRLQQYTVNVYKRDYLRYVADGGLVEEVVSGISIWKGGYDDKIGLSEGMRDPCDLIVAPD